MEVFMSVGCILGVALMLLFGRSFYESLLKSRWVKVQGVVRALVVEEHRNGIEGITYGARIDYDYSYLGVTRCGQHLFGANRFDQKIDAEQKLKPYGVGRELDVYVFANRPTTSSLTSGIRYDSLFGALFGGGVFLFCIVMLQSK